MAILGVNFNRIQPQIMNGASGLQNFYGGDMRFLSQQPPIPPLFMATGYQQQQNVAGTQNVQQNSMDVTLLSYGIPPLVIAQGDDAVRKYAQDNGINLPAKSSNGASLSANSSQSADEQILSQYGIPSDVIAQGDDAVRKYAQDNGINLPPKGMG